MKGFLSRIFLGKGSGDAVESRQSSVVPADGSETVEQCHTRLYQSVFGGGDDSFPRVEFQRLRARLEQWYRENPDYLRDVSQLREILSGVRGRIAVDIEGVLVYGKFIRSTFWEMGLYESCQDERLRRPLATEFVQALVDSGSEVLLWTGMMREDALKVLANAGVEIPDSVRMVDRDVYRPLLHAHPVKKRIIAASNLPDVSRSGLLESLEKASMKIPCVLGVDCLVDDHAYNDGWLCEKMKMRDEKVRLVNVRAFRLDNYEGFSIHHRSDRELLRVAEEVKMRIGLLKAAKLLRYTS